VATATVHAPQSQQVVGRHAGLVDEPAEMFEHELGRKVVVARGTSIRTPWS